MAAILRVSFSRDATTPPADVPARLHGAQTWRVLGFTFGQAALSTLLTLALGLPAAYVFARYTFPGKSLFAALTTVPFVLPNIVVAAAFTAVIGDCHAVREVITHTSFGPLVQELDPRLLPEVYRVKK